MAAEKDISFISGTSAMAEYNFYQSLILLALCNQDDTENTERLAKVEKLQLQMRIWAVNCEKNFLHKFLLVDAELARVEGRLLDAINGYDDAIESARINGFIQIEALAFELAAKFWHSIGKLVFARHYLEKQGFIILETNWRFHHKEIDIIAQKDKEVVFVEVKSRKNSDFGEPEEAVTEKKQNHLIEAAEAYLVNNNLDCEARFDVISIIDNNQIKHFPYAFYPSF